MAWDMVPEGTPCETVCPVCNSWNSLPDSDGADIFPDSVWQELKVNSMEVRVAIAVEEAMIDHYNLIRAFGDYSDQSDDPRSAREVHVDGAIYPLEIARKVMKVISCQ